MIRITKKFSFEAAHALYGHDGKCKYVHGHSYRLYVTIKGHPIQEKDHPKFGMVMDFSDLKKIVNNQIIEEWDHSILLNKESKHIDMATQLIGLGNKVNLVDYQPTIENMLLDIAKKLQTALPKDITLNKLKLYETENSYAEWCKEDNM